MQPIKAYYNEPEICIVKSAECTVGGNDGVGNMSQVVARLNDAIRVLI